MNGQTDSWADLVYQKAALPLCTKVYRLPKTCENWLNSL